MSLDRSQRARRAAATALVAAARRRGADDEVLDTALAGADTRRVQTTAEMIRWAGALHGTAPTPRYFWPANHLDARTIDRLRHDPALRATADAHLLRQLWSLAPDNEVDEIVSEVQQRLPAIVKSLRPERVTVNSPEEKLHAIDTVTRLLSATGRQAFLMSGTLLGVIRDGAPMATDYDVDLGLLPEPVRDDDVAERLRSDLDDIVETPGRLILTIGGVKVDLFAHERRDDLLWHSTEIHEWWNTPFELEQHDVMGITTWIPDQPERYLLENYGDGWTAPAMFFDMSFDTPNRRYRKSSAALSYLVRRTLLAAEHSDRWVYERSLHELADSFGIDITGGAP